MNRTATGQIYSIKRLLKNPMLLLASSIMTLGWSMSWFVGGPIDGLPGIDPQLLLELGHLNAAGEAFLHLLKYYSWPVIAGIAIGTGSYRIARMLTGGVLKITSLLKPPKVPSIEICSGNRDKLSV